MSRAVTDTGPLLHLQQIDQLSLLSLFSAVYISGHVREELKDYSVWSYLEEEKKLKVTVQVVTDIEVRREKRRWRALRLSNPDLSVLALMRRFPEAIVLTDDLELRRAVETAGHEVTGSVGIVVRGYKQGHLSYDGLVTAMDRLFNDSSLYLSRSFKNRVLGLIRELEKEKKESG